MKKKEQFRQGDLLFEEVASTPRQSTASSNPVLAYGEVTGHSHTLVGSFNRFDTQDEVFVTAGEACSVGHEEHAAIPLTKGKTYKVSRQREYDPRTSLARQVRD